MADYRLYHIRDGHFRGVDHVEAMDDGAAIRTAAALVGEKAAELWCGDRMVRAFPAAGPSTSPDPEGRKD